MDRIAISPNQRVVFMGDSITDSGRQDDPENLGDGYVMFISSWLSAMRPELKIEFLNRGINGNTVGDLEARWDNDCLGLAPDWISIAIGINDAVRLARGADEYTVQRYEAGYRRLLDAARSHTDARLILMHPFLIGIRDNETSWRPLVDERIAVVQRLAAEYGTIVIETDAAFAAACQHRPPQFWAPDAVHPTRPGHALLAQMWINAVSA